MVNSEEFHAREPTTDLCISAVNPVQPKQPVWRSVTCVEVVLHHFGCPLSRVVIGIELSSRHHEILRLLCLQLWRLKAQRADSVRGRGYTADSCGTLNLRCHLVLA